jgi:hypothetical protein
MGTVLLHQQATGDVRVTITLVSPLEFVNTGLKETIDFNLGSSFATGVTADNFNNSGTATTHYSLSSAVGGNHFDGFGDFQYAIKTDQAQGAGGALPSPLTFDVHATNLLETSFTTNAGGWFFGVDVYNSASSGTGHGNTGPIGTGSNGTLTTEGGQVPEPSSIVLLGSLVVGLTTIIRKKTQPTV